MSTTHAPTGSREAELDQLRAHVAWLTAERERLLWEVSHDELTGLPNRRLFASLAPAELRPGVTAALILLDLNGFKPINDHLGHDIGDHVLRVIAHRLTTCIPDCLVARLGGDEFVGVLASRDADPASPWWQQTVLMLSNAIAQPIALPGQTLNVTAAIGVATADEAVPVTDLLRRADLAMYQAKDGRTAFAVWRYGDVGPASPPVAPPAEDRPAPAAPVHEPWPIPSGTLFSDSTDAPTIDPDRRDPRDIVPAAHYRPADPVWVYRHGAWRPGIVECSSQRAVMVTYRMTRGAGTVVDTLAAECLLARATTDAHLDALADRHDTAA